MQDQHRQTYISTSGSLKNGLHWRKIILTQFIIFSYSFPQKPPKTGDTILYNFDFQEMPILCGFQRYIYTENIRLLNRWAELRELFQAIWSIFVQPLIVIETY